MGINTVSGAVRRTACRQCCSVPLPRQDCSSKRPISTIHRAVCVAASSVTGRGERAFSDCPIDSEPGGMNYTGWQSRRGRAAWVARWAHKSNPIPSSRLCMNGLSTP
jgi:hypothetical protein